MTLGAPMFFSVGQHYYERAVIMVDHSPEILSGAFKRPLGSNEELIISGYRRIDVVSVYVRVVDVFIALEQTYSRVFKGLKFCISVQLATRLLVELLLVLQVFFSLC